MSRIKDKNFNCKGIICVTILDEEYKVAYKSRAKLNNKHDIKRLFEEINMKGYNVFGESSWF